MKAIIGKKIGMTQVFDENGHVVPVTVIQAGPCWIVDKRTTDKNGYEAVQIGFDPARLKQVRKPRAGQFAKAKVEPTRVLQEIRGTTELEIGAKFTVDIFAKGATVAISGKSKGRGFQGVVKRHGYTGGPASHGSKTGRIPGSVGASAWPSRVVPGRRLPGHMGDAQVTVRNLTVVGVDAEQNLLWIKGSVPGARNTYLTIEEPGA